MDNRKITVLREAFAEDALFRYAFCKHNEMNEQALAWFFEFALAYCRKHGGVIGTPDGDGVLGWVPQSAFPPHPEVDVPAFAAPSLRRLNLHESTPEDIIAKRGTGFAYIWLLAVEAKSRRKGLAKKMLDEAIHQLQDRGFEECWLSTENPENRAFYEKNGFSLFREMESHAKLKTYIYYQKIF